MKREVLSEALGNINTRYIDEAVLYNGRGKASGRNVFFKLAAAAACFAIALAIGIPTARRLSVSSDNKPVVGSYMLVEYENAYLEIIENNPKALAKRGLETEITEELIGNHIAYLQKVNPADEHSGYIAADGETDTELLEYAPAPYKAVRILRDGDRYRFALFCNYLLETSECLPISAAFEVYGVSDPSDIASITPIKSGNSWKATGEAVTDGRLISDFYNEVTSLSAYSFDDYHDLVFADELAELEGTGGDIGSEAYTRVADDIKNIAVETKDGLRFAIHCFPSYGWISVSETMSHYQMTPAVSEWLSKYAE